MTTSVLVAGAGITGLAAGHELSAAPGDVRFEIVEARARAGGKVGGGPVGPLDVDHGADGFLARQSEMSELCREVGLGDDLVSPRTSRAFIWIAGDLRPVPSPSIFGVPLDIEALERSGTVSSEGVRDFRRLSERHHEPLRGDAGVGEVLRPRVGDEVFEMLVDPLLGGINAGNADELSIDAGASVLADAARQGGALVDVLRAGVPRSGQPVFHGVRGGSQRAIEALEESLGARIVTGCEVTGIDRERGGYTVETTRGSRPTDAVVLATPAPVTARLLDPHCPDAARLLAGVEMADVVLVTFVFEGATVGRRLDGSGFLVPRSEGLLMTACSWASSKWEHYDDGRHIVLRASAGRTDDRRWLELDDDAIVHRLLDELQMTIAAEPDPRAVRVSRWPQSLPQFRPGHLDRVERIQRTLGEELPGVVATGAAFRGLGLPACVRQGRHAARRALESTRP